MPEGHCGPCRCCCSVRNRTEPFSSASQDFLSCRRRVIRAFVRGRSSSSFALRCRAARSPRRGSFCLPIGPWRIPLKTGKGWCLHHAATGPGSRQAPVMGFPAGAPFRAPGAVAIPLDTGARERHRFAVRGACDGHRDDRMPGNGTRNFGRKEHRSSELRSLSGMLRSDRLSDLPNRARVVRPGCMDVVV